MSDVGAMITKFQSECRGRVDRIKKLVEAGDGKRALELYEEMQEDSRSFKGIAEGKHVRGFQKVFKHEGDKEVKATVAQEADEVVKDLAMRQHRIMQQHVETARDFLQDRGLVKIPL